MAVTLTVGTASGNKDATEIWVGTASGNKQASEGWIGTASGNKQFYSVAAPLPELTASISPASLTWDIITPGAFYTSHGEVTATPSGGVAPYSYSWETDTPSATPDDQTAASTGWDSSDGSTANVRCYVSDSAGQAIYTDYVGII